MFLSGWCEFPSAPCRAGKETWRQLLSRFCWNRAHPWRASELVSFLVGLRTYQHAGIKFSPSMLTSVQGTVVNAFKGNGSFHVKWTNEKTRPSLILFILGRLEVPQEVWKTANFHNFICCSFSLIALWNMKKCVIFRIHAIAKTLINRVVIDIEGCDKHEIEAFVKSFNLICLKTNFRKFSISRSFKIFLKFEFFKNLPF